MFEIDIVRVLEKGTMSKTESRQTKRSYYIGLFVFFGLVIALSAALVDYQLESKNIRSKVSRQALDVFEHKTLELDGFLVDLESTIVALRNNAMLLRYIAAPGAENYQIASSFFHSVSTSSPNFTQVRYLDSSGREAIRVDRETGVAEPVLISEEALQDKSHRSYFIETSRLPVNSFWYSRLDLNVEHKKIEVPHKPVFRVASPVYVDQQFKGIVIINVHAEKFLKRFNRDPFFDISMIDNDGYVIAATDSTLSWSRYLKTGITVHTEHPQIGESLVTGAKELELQRFGELYAGGVGSFLKRDGAIVVLHPKEIIIHNMEKDRRKAAMLITGIILLFSVPLAMLISRGPAKLHEKIADQNTIMVEYLELIDKNVHTSALDKDRVILTVSTAFAKTVGYEKEQMVGMKYDELYCATQPKEYYQKIWQTTCEGHTWSGEIQHALKNGECYWADAIIIPQKDDQQQIIGYSAIYQDITDKKHIEVLSITDVMTGLYNRRFFNTIIEKELNRAQREKNILAFAMLDVDYFKQYNDHYGHQKGDEVLKDLSDVIKDKLGRASDYCFRLGGEEFGLLVTDIEPPGAPAFVESVREGIEELGIEHKWSAVAEVVTVSVGLLLVTPGPGITVDKIYKLADETLYLAKEGGRNRMVQQKLEPVS